MELGLHRSQLKRSPREYDSHIFYPTQVFFVDYKPKANGIADIIVDHVTSEVYHIESRPSEAGRNVLVHTASGQEVVGAGWDVRTAVQEYGGGAAIVHNNIAYFSNLSDGCVYRVKVGGQPEYQRVSPGKRLTTLGDHPCQLFYFIFSSGKTIPICMSRAASQMSTSFGIRPRRSYYR